MRPVGSHPQDYEQWLFIVLLESLKLALFRFYLPFVPGDMLLKRMLHAKDVIK